jgi:hypothetical protein
VSELWTPGGSRPPEPPPSPAEQPTPEEVAALRDLHARLAATPVADVIVNHGIGIWQLALVHLGVITPEVEAGRSASGAAPPNLAEAGLAIDALAALVDGLADRLGEGEAMLRDALTQAQMLFVQLADARGDQPG